MIGKYGHKDWILVRRDGVVKIISFKLQYMLNTKWLVICPNGHGEIKIPAPLAARELQYLLGRRVATHVSSWYPEVLEQNQRAGFPAATFLDTQTPRKERLHHLSTFRPQGSDLNGLLKAEEIIDVSDEWLILLPDSALALFQKGDTRARVILLVGNSDYIDGFALSFQDRFPKYLKK